MSEQIRTASVIMAAGRGSRMTPYEGNKTLLPLIPEKSFFEGKEPILVRILRMLPPGPKAIIVNYKSQDVKNLTQHTGVVYCHQPELNGTGGAILAAREFLADADCESVTITMGDVPFVRPESYRRLLETLKHHPMAVLGFIPGDKKRYGVLEISDDKVQRITEWKYWRSYPEAKQESLNICNSGIYAVRKQELLRILPILESRPQIVHKERNGQMVAIQEYFLTDIVEYMNADGLSAGYVITEDESETMGIDDLESLQKAQELYRKMADKAAGA
ncbi:MAG: NTP transferase domain-containing protein [Desulfococcaceae bacterium]